MRKEGLEYKGTLGSIEGEGRGKDGDREGREGEDTARVEGREDCRENN